VYDDAFRYTSAPSLARHSEGKDFSRGLPPFPFRLASISRIVKRWIFLPNNTDISELRCVLRVAEKETLPGRRATEIPKQSGQMPAHHRSEENAPREKTNVLDTTLRHGPMG
jgi:hypothetical protein